MDNVLLRMENIHKRFPGVYALKSVNLELKAGEVHALLGENGAGKSTLIKVLGGIYEKDEGNLFINGVETKIGNVLDAQKNGIAIIHQELVLVPQMSVAENIYLGREPMRGHFVNKDQMNRDAEILLSSYNLNFKTTELIVNLTIAQQQMVEIIKAISYNSKILVMDEPTSSISESDVKFLFSIMKSLTAKGIGIIYISHKMSELGDICDRVTVLRDGEFVGTKVVKETTKDELIAMMVGRQLESYYIRDFQKPQEIVLKCEHICDFNMVKDASFELRKGEIIGFAGLVGAGRSELMKCIFGLNKNYSGKIIIDGNSKVFTSPVEALKAGIALVPEDRKSEGLYLQQDIQFNSTIEVLEEFISGVVYNSTKEIEITQKYINMMDTKTPSQKQKIINLSGGNQQKVMIGRWLATNPKILILDEPTRGVDVGAKAEIYTIMNMLAKKGMAIIMISSELSEIINMSDRVYVMSNGVTKGCINHEQVSQEKIMHLAAE